MLSVEIVCPSPEDFISEITAKNITLSDVQFIDAFTFTVGVERRDYPRLTQLSQTKGHNIKRLVDNGWLVWITYAFKRPILVCGLIFVILLTILLPKRILFVKVQGNSTIPSRNIVACVEKAGIAVGAIRKEIRSEQVKNYLLSELPELQWAGINTYGCVAVIAVRERTELSQELHKTGVSSIVSSNDGIVCSITVKSGTAVCSVGDAVKKGQKLISGYTDCGLSVKAEQAVGSVFAITKRDLTAVVMQDKTVRGTALKQVTDYSLKIGKKLIKLYNGSSNSDDKCAKIYEEIYVRLPGGFVLPIALVKESQTTFNSAQTQNRNQSFTWVPVYMDNYLYDHMEQGEILTRRYTEVNNNSLDGLRCQYYCKEMIGRQKDEEIIQ